MSFDFIRIYAKYINEIIDNRLILPRWKTQNLSPKIEIDFFDDFMEIGTYI